MAHTSGTATDYLDLLDALRAYLTLEGWTELDFVVASVGGGTAMQPDDDARLIFRGPGAGAGMEVFIDILTDWDAGIGSYSWRLRGMTDYTATDDWGSMPNNSPEVYFNVWQNTMDYWFYVTDRRVIVIVKIGVNYVGMYMGFMLPFALPSEYPMPFYVSGNFYTRQLPPFDNCGNRMLADPGVGAAYYLTRQSLVWHAVGNHLNTDNVNTAPACGLGYAIIWPHGVTRDDSRGISTDWASGGFLLQRPNVNGELALFQSHIIDPDLRVVVGALDGIYSTGGHNRTPEQVVTYSARDFRLFTNVFRTSAGDYFAVEEN